MTSSVNRDDAVAMLSAMGFANDLIPSALDKFNGDVEAAANWLIGVSGPASHDNEPAPDNLVSPSRSVSWPEALETNAIITIQGTISQYCVPYGRSACTCIALSAAAMFLAQMSAGLDPTDSSAPAPKPVDVINAGFLQQMIQKGVELYSIIRMHQSRSAVEHMSVEEVLQCRDALPSNVHANLEHLRLLHGAALQGVLSPDDQHPQNLPAMLASCPHDSHWRCIVVTKPPETVLLCLPPSSTLMPQQSYVLIDSHPRPVAPFRTEQAYARLHDTLADLHQASLTALFPPVLDLGPDTPELMLAMYNSFDLYVLEHSSEDSVP